MGTKNALTEKVYSGKDIMRIAYPILISLLMEQMIGMTDTAFLGRVGEVELGLSGCFHDGFWFRYRNPDSDCPS